MEGHILNSALLSIFPNSKIDDWMLSDDGAGAYISAWNRPEPQPPQARIDAVPQVARDAAHANARFKRQVEGGSKKEEALIVWIANKHGLTYAQALAEIKVIWEAL